MTLKEILIKRDGMTAQEADDAINEARELVLAGEDPEEVLESEFGLEPDYVFELLDMF